MLFSRFKISCLSAKLRESAKAHLVFLRCNYLSCSGMYSLNGCSKLKHNNTSFELFCIIAIGLLLSDYTGPACII